MTLKFRIILTLSEQDTRNKRQEPKLGLELGIMEKNICIRAVGHWVYNCYRKTLAGRKFIMP